MADSKISALPASTTPLAGTEVLPIVQGGQTRQVSVANLTAGRAVSALSMTLTNALGVASGGTGLTSATTGDLIYASGTNTWANLADVATGNALISGGVGVAPSWGKIGLTTHVSGILPTANGGTNLSSFNANGILYASSSSVLATDANFTYVPGSYQASLTFSNATTWTPDTSGVNLQLINTSATANSTALYLAQVKDDANTTGGVKFGAVAVASGTSGGYSADFVIANRKAGTYYENFRVKYNGDISFVTGNLIQGTAAKGINFTANTPAAGKTSQLLNWYEEGTWTPAVSGFGAVTYTVQNGKYTRIGNIVHLTGKLSFSGASGSSAVSITGLPYSSADAVDTGQRASCFVEGDWTGCASFISSYGMFRANGSSLQGVKNSAGASVYALASDFSATVSFNFNLTYYV